MYTIQGVMHARIVLLTMQKSLLEYMCHAWRSEAGSEKRATIRGALIVLCNKLSLAHPFNHLKLLLSVEEDWTKSQNYIPI